MTTNVQSWRAPDIVFIVTQLPTAARTGVLVASELFSELTSRIDRRPVVVLLRYRVSVPHRIKAVAPARAVINTARPSRSISTQ